MNKKDMIYGHHPGTIWSRTAIREVEIDQTRMFSAQNPHIIGFGMTDEGVTIIFDDESFSFFPWHRVSKIEGDFDAPR